MSGAIRAPMPLRRADPVVLVPAGDEVVAPLTLDRRRDRRGGGAGERAERIAVEIDDAVGKDEPLAAMRQRVGGVARQRLVERHSLGKVTPRWPIYLPARSL